MNEIREFIYEVSLNIETKASSPLESLGDLKDLMDYTDELIAHVKCVDTDEYYLFRLVSEKPWFLEIDNQKEE
jgi:hypothetical protein